MGSVKCRLIISIACKRDIGLLTERDPATKLEILSYKIKSVVPFQTKFVTSEVVH